MNLNSDPQKYYIKTFGCQMNVADTEKMEALLADTGMVSAHEPDDADLILINGCSVREKAVHKAVSALGTYRELKTGLNKKGQPISDRPIQRKRPILGVGGCVGQLEKKNLFQSAPYLDFVFGPDAIDHLPEILHRVRAGERQVIYTDFDRSENFSTETRLAHAKAQAFVNIMKGCDKYCTYCIVPFTRGREKSRTIQEVVEDVAQLVTQGVREVTLLGQNVNSFGKGNPNLQNREPAVLHNPIGIVGPKEGEENFPQLIRAIDQDPRCSELKRIRFTSSHPLDFSDELIDCYSEIPRLAPHLHLPVQSGSNRVLRKMGRKHKIEHYIEQMDRLRKRLPDVGMSTDLIVGFPTETEEEFEETLALLDRVQYDSIYAFAYSPRPGTRASKLEDDVPKEVKSRRLNQLLAHQLKIAETRYRSRIGKEMEVLVEGTAKNQGMVESGKAEQGSEIWMGRTGCHRVVNFVVPHTGGRNLTGKFLRVKITGATSLSLFGELVQDSQHAENAEGIA